MADDAPGTVLVVEPDLDQLPPTGVLIFAAPLKIRQGSGSPLRVLAMIDNQGTTK